MPQDVKLVSRDQWGNKCQAGGNEAKGSALCMKQRGGNTW